MKCTKIKNKINTRFCTPFTIKCTNCGDYTYKNKRHNSKQEIIKDEDYCGIKIYRFIFKCRKCKIKLSIKTDPKNGEYVTEDNCIKFEEIIVNQNEKFVDLNKLKKDIEKLYELEKKFK